MHWIGFHHIPSVVDVGRILFAQNKTKSGKYEYILISSKLN